MKKSLDYETLREFIEVSEIAESPDGAMTAYVRRTADYRTGKSIPQIRITGQEITFEKTNCQCAPVWSEDGKSLYYLGRDNNTERDYDSGKEPGISQLWIKDMEDGSERRLTGFRHGVREFKLLKTGEPI